MSASSSQRWWEFYAVRYGMGSVVGAVLFFFLCKSNPSLTPLLLNAGTAKGEVSAALLTLLGAYGLTFCYIASAPILVFHVGRFMIQSDNSDLSDRWWTVARSSIPVIGTYLFFVTFDGPMSGRVFYTAVTGMALMIIWPQYVIVIACFCRRKQLLDFYQRLASKRTISSDDLVESYRHLREHGNSFFIVVLELALATILFSSSNFEHLATSSRQYYSEVHAIPYVIIVFLWIIPAALVWLIGTLLERDFMERQ